MTIVFKNAAMANDNFDSSAVIKQLFPDQETYKKEEQCRFEILDAHWDLPIRDVDLDARRCIYSVCLAACAKLRTRPLVVGQFPVSRPYV